MTTTAIAILWPALRSILIRIGRWVLRNCLIEGARGLAVYLRMRARHFAERRANETDKRKRAQLARRAQRYLKASRWFADNARQLTARALAIYERQAERIPEQSRFER